MQIYEELEREASLREQKQETQLNLILGHTKVMREDLGSTEEARLANRGHLQDIETFEKDIKLRLRSHLLTDQ